MNNTSNLGAASSTSRGPAIRNVTLPAATAAGSIVVALDTGVPAVLGGLNPGNHNETLLSAAGGAEPRRHLGRLRRAASILVLSGDSSTSKPNAFTGQHCSSTGGGELQCQPRPIYDGFVR